MRLSMKKPKTSRKSRGLKIPPIKKETKETKETTESKKVIVPVNEEETEIQSFYINSLLKTIKLDTPVMCVFKSKSDEMSFEPDGNTKVKIKIHSSKQVYPLTKSFTFKELERVLTSYINKKAGN
jgi:hypothetical protein